LTLFLSGLIFRKKGFPVVQNEEDHWNFSKSKEVIMKRHLFSKMVVVGALVAMMGFGVNAFAGMGKGAGNRGMGAASSNLTDDQIKQMESERNAFQTATTDIRQQLNEKRQALNAELAKPAPDAATAATLQKEISDLQAQFDQKRLTHILEMKRIDPNYTEGRGMGRGPFGGGPTN
jgi:Spy/CpxP family protein refolding chaperone